MALTHRLRLRWKHQKKIRLYTLGGVSTKLNPIELFAAKYCSHYLKCKVPPFHREMYEIANRGDKRIVICAPRSFAKSTVFSVIVPLYQICVGDIGGIILISATGSLAETWLRKIKHELENNNALMEDFGIKESDNKWTQDHIICARPDGTKVEVKAKGWGYQLRGFRPDLIVVDDIEADEQVRSSDQREKQKDWFNKALINTLEPDSQLIMVGTMLHPLSLLNDVMHRKLYTTKKYQAVLPDNTSLWPEKWSREALQEREDEIGKLAFMSEFQNEPVITENPIFIRDWFRYYDSDSITFSDEVSKGLHTVVIIDPAISKKESADYSAIVTISATFDAEPTFYVRKGGLVRGHWPINKQVTELIRIYDKFSASKIIIETTAYQEALADEVKRWCDDNHRHIVIKQIKPDKDKERRAHSIVPSIERGRVNFDKEDTMQCILMDEMSVFPTGTHDDCVDAFVHGMQDLRDWAGRSKYVQEGANIVLPGPRSKYTGVA